MPGPQRSTSDVPLATCLVSARGDAADRMVLPSRKRWPLAKSRRGEAAEIGKVLIDG